ncbi:FAD-binding protein, partial [Paraburkholderia sp. BR14261]
MDTVQSWGRYPALPQQAHAIAWRDRAAATWREVIEANGNALAFGNGRSYGDSCLAASDHVLQT